MPEPVTQSEPAIRIDVRDHVATVTIDRPPVNALLLQTYREITEMFDALSKRTDVNCVIFTGAGTRAFCAGLDLKEFVAAKPEEDEARAAVVRATFKAVRTTHA